MTQIKIWKLFWRKICPDPLIPMMVVSTKEVPLTTQKLVNITTLLKTLPEKKFQIQEKKIHSHQSTFFQQSNTKRASFTTSQNKSIFFGRKTNMKSPFAWINKISFKIIFFSLIILWINCSIFCCQPFIQTQNSILTKEKYSSNF